MLQRVVTSAIAAHIRLLSRIKLRVHRKSMLQIINPQLRRFLITDRAQMPGHLNIVFVRLVDRRLDVVFLAGDRGGAASFLSYCPGRSSNRTGDFDMESGTG